MGKSRRHEWLSECLGHLVMAIAVHLRHRLRAGGRGDLSPPREGSRASRGIEHSISVTNAERMRGWRDYDFDVDPPPDLAIEVEVSHSADDAIAAWGRLGVPEVWRFDAATFACSRSGIGSTTATAVFEQSDRSLGSLCRCCAQARRRCSSDRARASEPGAARGTFESASESVGFD